jgi:hypothetical protein
VKAPVGVGGFERGEILSGGWRVARVGTQASGVVQSIMTFTLFYDPKGDEDRSFVERLHELVAVQNGHNLIKLEKHAMHERQRSLRSNRHRNRISHDTPLSSADASSVTTRPRRRSISDGRTRFEYARLFVGEAALAGEFVRTIFDFAALVSAEGYSVLIALLFFAFACHQWMMSRSEIVISRFFSVVSSIAHQTSVAETPTKKKYFFFPSMARIQQRRGGGVFRQSKRKTRTKRRWTWKATTIATESTAAAAAAAAVAAAAAARKRRRLVELIRPHVCFRCGRIYCSPQSLMLHVRRKHERAFRQLSASTSRHAQESPYSDLAGLGPCHKRRCLALSFALDGGSDDADDEEIDAVDVDDVRFAVIMPRASSSILPNGTWMQLTPKAAVPVANSVTSRLSVDRTLKERHLIGAPIKPDDVNHTDALHLMREHDGEEVFSDVMALSLNLAGVAIVSRMPGDVMVRFNYRREIVEWHYCESGFALDSLFRIAVPLSDFDAMTLSSLVDNSTVLTLQMCVDAAVSIERACEEDEEEEEDDEDDDDEDDDDDDDDEPRWQWTESSVVGSHVLRCSRSCAPQLRRHMMRFAPGAIDAAWTTLLRHCTHARRLATTPAPMSGTLASSEFRKRVQEEAAPCSRVSHTRKLSSRAPTRDVRSAAD